MVSTPANTTTALRNTTIMPGTQTTPPSPSGPRLSLMPQQLEVRDLEDDWTGVGNSVQRRKLQNRLNQRAYRRKKRLLKPGEGDRAGDDVHELSPAHTIPNEGEGTSRAVNKAPEPWCILVRAEAQELLRQFAEEAYRDHTLHSPRPSHLPLLIRLNLLRAITHNAVLMGMAPEGLCRDEEISPFSPTGTGRWLASSPGTLQPTALQLSVEHHPWIDLFPFADMRDNFLRALAVASFDEDELCCDILECSDSSDDRPSLLVWGEPSDPSNWEASVGFLRKWGWLVRQSRELLDATNHWRGIRGEKRLAFGFDDKPHA